MRIDINNIIERVEETRRVVAENGAEELAESITVQTVLQGVIDMNNGGTEWTVEDELQDLIWESWGEDC